MSAVAKPSGLFPALLAVQQELPKLQKDAINPHFKNRYISLDGLMAAIRPVLAKHGLVWITEPCRDAAGEPALAYKLMHESGEGISNVMPLMMAKSDPQGQGSAITYARRYSITAVLGLVADEDDDGHKATQGKAAQRATNGDRATPRLLTPQERDRMLGVIADTDQNEQLLFAAVGVSSIDEVNVEHAKKIRALIDQAVTA